MHVPAPLSVEFRETSSGIALMSRVHGATMSGPFHVFPRNPSFTVERQWARAFLEGVIRAPFVVGVFAK
jgi:hypothetical protein